jgi:DNA-directed RNA polymerase subunit M/transcription elongation factor TFIIS
MATPLPQVICPGCKQRMTPPEPTQLVSAGDLQELTYTCALCGTGTVRTFKTDGPRGRAMPRQLPQVICPGCKQPMNSSEPTAVLSADELQELTYTCTSCGMTTVRLIKTDND